MARARCAELAGGACLESRLCNAISDANKLALAGHRSPTFELARSSAFGERQPTDGQTDTSAIEPTDDKDTTSATQKAGRSFNAGQRQEARVHLC